MNYLEGMYKINDLNVMPSEVSLDVLFSKFKTDISEGTAPTNMKRLTPAILVSDEKGEAVILITDPESYEVLRGKKDGEI